MKLKMIMLAAVMASGGFAQGAAINSPGPQVDLNMIQSDPLELIKGLSPSDDQDNDKKDHMKNMPQACTDAAITDDQKTKIKEAIFNNKRDRVQLEANLKVAFMNYAQTVMDKTSDMTAAQTTSAAITDAIHKMADSHLALGNDILYNLVTPDQRAKTFECIVALHKMHRKGKRH